VWRLCVKKTNNPNTLVFVASCVCGGARGRAGVGGVWGGGGGGVGLVYGDTRSKHTSQKKNHPTLTRRTHGNQTKFNSVCFWLCVAMLGVSGGAVCLPRGRAGRCGVVWGVGHIVCPEVCRLPGGSTLGFSSHALKESHLGPLSRSPPVCVTGGVAICPAHSQSRWRSPVDPPPRPEVGAMPPPCHQGCSEQATRRAPPRPHFPRKMLWGNSIPTSPFS